MHDNLVSYVNKLKSALLSHSLTPLEDSLVKHSGKRSDIDTQESTDDLEAEYSDLPDRKKFKKSDSFLDDLLSERPIRSTAPPPNYVAPTEDDEDIMEIDTISEPVGESRSSVDATRDKPTRSRRSPDKTVSRFFFFLHA